LLDDPYNAAKFLLPVVARNGFSEAERVAKQSLSYVMTRDNVKLRRILEYLAECVKFYSNLDNKREAFIAMDMGIRPIEFKAIRAALNASTYKEAVEKVAKLLAPVVKADERAVNEVVNYGYLAIWVGSPKSRTLAEEVEATLETGAFFVARVYGYKSWQREKLINLAKMFTYAGNANVEPLAKKVRIEVLRRMVKAAPQIVTGAAGSEAVSATIIATSEAFYRRKPSKEKISEIASLVWKAVTGQDIPENVLEMVVKEVVSRWWRRNAKLQATTSKRDRRTVKQ
jgi:hypothetical protein